MPLTIVAVANDLLSKLGIEGSDPSQASALAQQDVVVAINGAMQRLQTAGQDFFTRQKIILTLGAGTSVYQISQAVQAVIGPIRLNDAIPLWALSSRGQLDEFDRMFLGASSFGAAPGVPIAYWVECLNNGNATGNIERINIYPVPVPTGASPGTLAVEVVDTAPSYAVADLTNAGITLPIAQNYTEAIFLPIARFLVTRSSQFSRQELLPSLTQDYQDAMTRLGYAGGFPISDQDPPAPPRKTQA
jgi:hypothetical protein